MKYEFIYKNREQYPVQRMCHQMKIKRDAYYAWLRRGPSDRDKYDEEILSKIIEFREDKDIKKYGSPRLCLELKDAGFTCGHNKIARIMRINGIRAEIRRKHKYKLPKTDEKNVVENKLNREFTQTEPDKVYVSDVTYIPTLSGWAYLCVFMDLFSRKIVGWSISSNPNTEFILRALNNAAINRMPKKGLMIHSDRGCQYTSNFFKKYLKDNEYIQSMSRKGNCWDNACVESFFSHLKSEAIFGNVFNNVSEVKRAVFEYIEIYYNRKRRHSSCGNVSPVKFEEQKKVA